jgi:hypothetical protein
VGPQDGVVLFLSFVGVDLATVNEDEARELT